MISLSLRPSLSSSMNLTTIFLTARLSNLLNLQIISNLFLSSGLKKSLTALSSLPVLSNSLPKPMLFVSFSLAPRLLVNIIIQFLISTVLPAELVTTPSSIIASKMFDTSGCAFSISSNNIIENGFLVRSDINLPPPTLPSSNPT